MVGAVTHAGVCRGRSVLVRSRRALLLALGVDNAGSGLFLPLVVVYLTRVVGLPLARAGVLLTAGTLHAHG